MSQSSRTASPTRTVSEIFAAQGAKRWALAQTSSHTRIARLKRLRKAVFDHKAAIVEAATQDLRRHPVETEAVELVPAIAEIGHTIKNLAEWMEPQTVPSPLSLFGAKSEVHRVARGRTLVISPWNYPFQLALNPIATAVAAGNPVILKPSELAPATARVLRQIVESVFPFDEAAVIEGGVEVSTELLALPFDHFFYTGGGTVGRIVMQAAAKHLSAVTLELGGKSPVIVDDEVDLDRVAERVVWGKLINGGQTCVAPDYLLVPKARERDLIERIKARIAATYGATVDAQKKSPDYARMVSTKHLARMRELVEKSVAAGAKVECGAAYDDSERFIAPTVLSGVRSDHAIMQEEIFGPVLPIIPYDRIEDALARVQAEASPLALYIFSDRTRFVDQVLANTTSGGAVINDVVIHLANPDLPFGGVGPSGMGSYHGIYGFRAFSHERAVVKQGRFSSAKLLYPPYTNFARKLLKWVYKTL